MQKKSIRTKPHTVSKKRRVSLWVKVVVLCVLLGGFIYAMNQEYFFMKRITVSGNEVLTNKEVLAVTDDYLALKKFWIFPRKNTFFLDTGALEKYLTDNFPRIYRVQVAVVERGDVLQIEIEERKAHSLWCNNREYEKQMDQECYYADQDGYIYAESPYFSSKVFTKVFVPPGEIIQQQQIHGGRDFELFFNFLEKMQEEYDINIQRIERDMHGDVHVFIWNINGYIYKKDFPSIVYSSDMDYERVLQNIQLTLDHQSFKSAFLEQPRYFKNIDVRFDGRIFFTFNDK